VTKLDGSLLRAKDCSVHYSHSPHSCLYCAARINISKLCEFGLVLVAVLIDHSVLQRIWSNQRLRVCPIQIYSMKTPVTFTENIDDSFTLEIAVHETP
jgi:hypothetical protein